MKALIIGGAGFVGSYLAEHLYRDYGWDVEITKLPYESLEIPFAKIFDLDILDQPAIAAFLRRERPDYIFHLAAQSSVWVSWKHPGLTIDVNIKGAVNMLDAVRDLDYKPRVLLVGSGEEYGLVKESECPISEDNPLRPVNIYAATKVCQNQIGKIYADAYGMDIVMTRAFNHIGPRQSNQFVVSDFCRQVAEIEAGISEPVIHVGNLEAKRDFTDVSDVVRAYALLLIKGKTGETYNIGCGKAVSISEVLNRILTLGNRKIEVKADPAKFRPVDAPIIQADISKIQNDTGWIPEYTLEKTIVDILNYWRSNVSDNKAGIKNQ